MDKMNYIHRDLEALIEKYLHVKEIIAVVGIRQCGKTTLLKYIANELKKGGKQVNFISFDDVGIMRMFEDDIISFQKLHVVPYEYVFIDEIQYSRESGKKLKYLYGHTDTKILISGSSSAELSVESLKFLAGRVFIFTLFPFSFREFLKARSVGLVSLYDEGNYGTALIDEMNVYLKEFLLYGGFPRVVMSKDNEEKQLVLRNIFSTYILREIREIFQISNEYKLVKLIKGLSLQVGGMINYQELCHISETNIPELKRYLDILQKTFILSLIRPYYSNRRTELVKIPKIYFIDHGFRNSCLENFSESLTITGVLNEQYVFSECIKNELSVKYWRSKSRAEVDFVIEKNGPIPVEVKTQLYEQKISLSYHSFIEKYNPVKAYMFSQTYEGHVQKGKMVIYFFPLCKVNKLWR